MGNRADREPVRFDALEAMRKFSGILAHSLEPRALLREFLLLLREVIGVNRAIIFLRNPPSLAGGPAPEKADWWLRSACAIGIEHSFLDHFALSLATGLGAHLRKHGRILRSNSPEVRASRELAREFQLAGAVVAIPILDRQSLLGVALLDERLTGGAYESEELSLLFHMLEEVALAIRNSWLHEQLQTSHAMLADILGNLATACVVVGSDLAILHCNNAARRILIPDEKEKRQPEFSDLPQELGSRVFTVLKTSAAASAFNYQFPALPGRRYRAAISPFRTQSGASADAALLIVEDITAIGRARQPEAEPPPTKSNGDAGEHLAEDTEDSVMPLSPHERVTVPAMSEPGIHPVEIGSRM